MDTKLEVKNLLTLWKTENKNRSLLKWLKKKSFNLEKNKRKKLVEKMGNKCLLGGDEPEIMTQYVSGFSLYG